MLKRSFQWQVLLGVIFLVGESFAGVRIPATLEKVTDGDTVIVRDKDGKQMKIRYLGMDAPELHFQGRSQEPFGQEASDHLLDILGAKPAKINKAGRVSRPCVDRTTEKAIEVEVELDGKDKYKRDLGYVFYKGVSTNLKMTEDGQAFPYLYCTKSNCTKDWFKDAHAEEYVEACKSARKAGLGIFKPGRTLSETPSQFRRRIGRTAAYQYIGDFDTKRLYQPEDDKLVDPCVVIRFESENDAIALGYKY